tara:strand:+ start:710 stop:3400 length:2691 start_codon:yes stop_codon:yes gene_type:complete
MKIIHSNEEILWFRKAIDSFKKLFTKKITFISLSYLLIVFISIVSIFEIQSIFYTYQKGRVVLVNSISVAKNYLESFQSDIDSLSIDIGYQNLQRLEYIRSLSAEHYVGLDNEDQVSLMRKEWVSAKINHEGETIPIKIRIKGQSVDHWGKFPSYKIKVGDGKTIFGMKRFALQHPKTRGFMNEWYYHQFLKFNDLIHLRYDFVNLSVNGDSRPIYAIEENFGKRLLENNNRKDGLIFRIIKSQVQIQQPKSEINKVNYMKNGVQDLKNKINQFYQGDIKAKNVFDIKSMAKLYAISDLWGNRHAIQLKNTRFYYNPITTLIEPIAYDQQVIYKTQHLGLMGEEKRIGKNLSEDSDFFDLLFNDKFFYAEYIKQLEIIANKDLLDNFFETISEEEKSIVSKIYKSYPYYEYKSIYPSLEWAHQDRNNTRHLNSIWLPKEKQVLFDNQNYIRDITKININSVIINKINFNQENKKLELRIFNNEAFPINVNSVKIGSTKNIIPLKETILIEAKNHNKLNNYVDIELEATEFNTLLENQKSKLFLMINIYGSNNNIAIPVKDKIALNYVNKLYNFSDLQNINGIIIDEVNKIIKFKSQKHIISEDLVINSGYRVIAEEGTKIELKNNSNLISYSPFLFTGSYEDPIIITSDSGGSIALINTEKKSFFSNIVLSNLSDFDYDQLNISGGINFYQSDVDINSCLIINGLAEDAINIVRSNFLINDCTFKNSFSDAVDIDFSTGTIADSTFLDIGNDSIDLSGSNVQIEGIKINNSSDKGISIGEKSHVNINHIDISNAKIALAVKDKSTVYIDKKLRTSSSGVPYEGVIINNCEYGIAIYQKKPEYGPAEVFVGRSDQIYKNILIKDTDDHFIVEYGSFLKVGSQRVENYRSNVFKKIYN